MEYFLNDRQKIVQQVARKIAEERIVPVRAYHDRTGEFPWEVVEDMAKADLFRIFIPEEYEGLGYGVFELVLAVEQLSWGCGGIALPFAATALGTFPIIHFGNPEQKKKYLPDIAAGRKLAAFALTEPTAGSDAAGVRTTAIKEGDHYIINGMKQWITNGGVADVYVVIALTDPGKGARGASAFIVERGTPGFRVGKDEDKMGIRASSTTSLFFDNVKVPRENLLGREGMGFMIALHTLDRARPGVAAQSVGIAQAALEEALKHARTREQFGQSIINFQGIQFMLAEMATKIEAARSLTYSVARHIDSGARRISKESAMAKLFASDVAMEVTTQAVQILGGFGYMKDYPVEKMMRDAKVTQIYEGTNQIQRLVIASQLVKEAASLI